MFDTAYVVIDDLARPVLILPETLPDGEAFLTILDGAIEIGVANTIHGKIDNLEDEVLNLLGLHNTVGMATFDMTHKTMPDDIQYVANVTDKRN